MVIMQQLASIQFMSTDDVAECVDDESGIFRN